MRGEIILDDVAPWARVPRWLAVADEPKVFTTCAPAGTEPIEAVLRLADAVSRWPQPKGREFAVLVYSTTMPGPELVDRMEELHFHGPGFRHPIWLDGPRPDVEDLEALLGAMVETVRYRAIVLVVVDASAAVADELDDLTGLLWDLDAIEGVRRRPEAALKNVLVLPSRYRRDPRPEPNRPAARVSATPPTDEGADGD